MAREELIDVRAAAELSGRHPETVRRWIWSGRLVAQRQGSRLLVARADVEDLAATKGARPTSLSAWAAGAVHARDSAAARGTGRSAADLVLEDRLARSVG